MVLLLWWCTMMLLRCNTDKLKFCVSSSSPPFGEQELHVHDACELYYLIKGNGYYVTEGTRYDFVPGMILLMRPGESHCAVRFDSASYERISIHFHPSIVDSLDSERHILRTFYNRTMGTRNYYNQEMLANTNIYQYLEKMAVPCGDAYAQSVRVLSYLLPVLTELGEVFDKNTAPAMDKNALLIHDILDFINQNLSTSLSVDVVCNKFFISRIQLYRIFKKATEMNVWEYIVLKRLVLARSMINDGMSAGEAAKACGFADYSTFYRAYVAKYGAPPSGIHRNNKRSR